VAPPAAQSQAYWRTARKVDPGGTEHAEGIVTKEHTPDPGTLTSAELKALRAFYESDAYAELLGDPMNWLQHAQRLFRSATILSKQFARAFSDDGTIPNPASGGRIVIDHWKLVDIQLHLVAAMLYGYSLELLAKGVLIAMSPLTPAKLNRLPKHLDTHNLERLVEDTKIPLDANEKEILPFLRDCVYWMGRYPVPLSGPVARRKWQERFSSCSTEFREADVISRGLYDKLYNALKAAQQSQSHS
jgi:hypothetical protein